MCVCFCVGESSGSDKNSWGFQSGQQFSAVFPQACSSFLSSVLTNVAGNHLRSLSGLDKRLIKVGGRPGSRLPLALCGQAVCHIRGGKLLMGPSDVSEREEGGFSHVCERVQAVADADLGSSVATLIQHTSRHQSPCQR